MGRALSMEEKMRREEENRKKKEQKAEEKMRRDEEKKRNAEEKAEKKRKADEERKKKQDALEETKLKNAAALAANRRRYKGRGVAQADKGHVLRCFKSDLIYKNREDRITLSPHDPCEKGGLGIPIGLCIFCKVDLKKKDHPTEHLIPTLPPHNGNSETVNVAYCCSACNSKKGQKSIEMLIEEYPNSKCKRFGYNGIVSLDHLHHVKAYIDRNLENMTISSSILNPSNDEMKPMFHDDMMYEATCHMNGVKPFSKMEFESMVASLRDQIRSSGLEPVV